MTTEMTPQTTASIPRIEIPPVIRELGLDKQNRAVIGRLILTGGFGFAAEGPGGRLYAQVRIPADELIWQPSVIIMPHEGELELELINDDDNDHAAFLPSNGDFQWIHLVQHSRGSATLSLDGPGCYWFGSPYGNDEGRGLVGVIAVLGETPPQARLDRPPQPRP